MPVPTPSSAQNLRRLTDKQLADGTVVWTSPAGKIYRTQPAGADLFPELAAPPPPPRIRPRAKRRAAYVARERNLNHLQAIKDELKQARKDEIADRKWRNQMRGWLFLYKRGAPNTSPYCTWINDPPEPEELPPDWTPPQPEPQPDECPF